MSSSKLPDRASLEYLKRLAKDRLRDLRRSDPSARLAAAQLAVAREHGFPSWRVMKGEVDRRRAPAVDALFAACHAGDVGAGREGTDCSRDSGLHVVSPHQSNASPLRVLAACCDVRAELGLLHLSWGMI